MLNYGCEGRDRIHIKVIAFEKINSGLRVHEIQLMKSLVVTDLHIESNGQLK